MLSKFVPCPHDDSVWTRWRLVSMIEELAHIGKLNMVEGLYGPPVLSFATPFGGEVLSRIFSDEFESVWELRALWPRSSAPNREAVYYDIVCSLSERIPCYTLGKRAWKTRRRLIEQAEAQLLGTDSVNTEKSPLPPSVQVSPTIPNPAMKLEPENPPAATSDDQGNHMPSQSDPPPRPAPASRRPRRGGRPRLSAAESEKRRSIVAKWNRAKEKRVRQKDFCTDENVSLEYLTKCINWVAQRKRRHDSP